MFSPPQSFWPRPKVHSAIMWIDVDADGRIDATLMADTIREKAAVLTLDQFVQEMVLGKIASDIYNEAKAVAPLSHVGIRKSKLVAQPSQPLQAPQAPEPVTQEEAEPTAEQA